MLIQRTTKEILEAYGKLPKKITDLFWSDDVSVRLQKIEKSFNLTKEQGDQLTEIMSLLFLGFLPPYSISKEIEKRFSLDEFSSKKITEDFFRMIVFPLQGALTEIYAVEDFKMHKDETIKEKLEREKRGGINDGYREPID